MSLEQLIQRGKIPSQFTKQAYKAHHLSAKQRLNFVELEQLLERAQKGYDPRTDGILIEYIAKLIKLESSGGIQKSLNQRDENTINFVCLLLEQIAKNANEQSADLLLMLAIPFARLALKDNNFLLDSKHPARHTLNLLIHLSQTSVMPQKAFQIIQLYVTTITLRYKGQDDFFASINQQLETYYADFRLDLSEQLQLIEKQFDPKQKLAKLAVLNEIYIKELTRPLPQQLSFTALLHYFLHSIFTRIASSEKHLQQSWLAADTDISRFLDLFNRRNMATFREAHKQLADHIKTFNSYLLKIQIPLSLRRLFFEQAQQLLQLIIQGRAVNSIQDEHLKHSDALNQEADLLLQTAPLLNQNVRLGYENQINHNAFTHGQSADANSIVKLHMGQWVNIMIDGKRTPCQICFYAKQRQSFFFCTQTQQQLFERNGGDFVIDLQMGYAELLIRCTNIEAVFMHNIAYLQHYQKLQP